MTRPGRRAGRPVLDARGGQAGGEASELASRGMPERPASAPPSLEARRFICAAPDGREAARRCLRLLKEAWRFI